MQHKTFSVFAYCYSCQGTVILLMLRLLLRLPGMDDRMVLRLLLWMPGMDATRCYQMPPERAALLMLRLLL